MPPLLIATITKKSYRKIERPFKSSKERSHPIIIAYPKNKKKNTQFPAKKMRVSLLLLLTVAPTLGFVLLPPQTTKSCISESCGNNGAGRNGPSIGPSIAYSSMVLGMSERGTQERERGSFTGRGRGGRGGEFWTERWILNVC